MIDFNSLTGFIEGVTTWFIFLAFGIFIGWCEHERRTASKFHNLPREWWAKGAEYERERRKG